MEQGHRDVGQPAKSSPLLLPVCYLGFVSLGLPDTLVGIAWPSVREKFGLHQNDLSWIFIGGGCSYFFSSFFTGRLLKVVNIGVLLAISSGLVALSGFDYALSRTWLFFAAGSLLHGLGSGAIDTGLNHYVASHFSARHMNWLHASYSVGAMLGPLVMTWAITARGSYRLGYATVASTLLFLSLLFLLTQKLWSDGAPLAQVNNAKPSEQLAGIRIGTTAALRHGLVWMHILLFFLYTGFEVALGQWSFTVLTEGRGINPKTAGLWVTLYWTGILAGRVGFGFIVDMFGIDRLIRFSTMTALAGISLFVWNPARVAAPLGLAFAGVGLAVIFPCLMTRTPQRFGKAVAAHAIGFQVAAAMIGAAALPSFTGVIAQYGSISLVPTALWVMGLTLFLLHEFLLQQEHRFERAISSR